MSTEGRTQCSAASSHHGFLSDLELKKKLRQLGVNPAIMNGADRVELERLLAEYHPQLANMSGVDSSRLQAKTGLTEVTVGTSASTSGLPQPSSAACLSFATETKYTISGMKAILEPLGAPVASCAERSDLERLLYKYYPSRAKQLPVAAPAAVTAVAMISEQSQATAYPKEAVALFRKTAVSSHRAWRFLG